MHLKMPLRYLASSDAYTQNNYSMTKTETAFYQTLNYLSLCEKNGIVLNKDNFQFCQDVVQFGGL